MNWEWKRPPSGAHDDQPLVEWWYEQAAACILMHIAKRAHRRDDQQTFRRVFAIVRAGGDAEAETLPLDEGDTAVLNVVVARANAEQAFIGFRSMEGPFSIRVPLRELRRTGGSRTGDARLVEF